MLHLFCCYYFECNNEHPEDEIDMRDPTHFAVDVSVAINIKIVVVYYMYLITRVSMQYRELLHKWAWYFHEP